MLTNDVKNQSDECYIDKALYRSSRLGGNLSSHPFYFLLFICVFILGSSCYATNVMLANKTPVGVYMKYWNSVGSLTYKLIKPGTTETLTAETDTSVCLYSVDATEGSPIAPAIFNNGSGYGYDIGGDAKAYGNIENTGTVENPSFKIIPSSTSYIKFYSGKCSHYP